ncbi:hypothetical protein PVAND_010905 [Polypedilum vanderplanki]|uniref:THAP-type domain-containing protein n=1 Tax=Polypedilum vanderplanki TaxID=319348 RepID=A0A9J6CH01_POLVA|nr:hypothetical protein PVAND_010905 [Polypedilum vanderplanki]
MVRRCCVPNCSESDITILSHRFPKDDGIAQEWKSSLGIENIALEDLRQKYSVCTKHFSSVSYRNVISNSLNTTAIPTLEEHLDNERITSTRNREKNITSKRCNKRAATVSIDGQIAIKKIILTPEGIKKEVLLTPNGFKKEITPKRIKQEIVELKQTVEASPIESTERENEEEQEEEEQMLYNDSMVSDLGYSTIENQVQPMSVIYVDNSTMTNKRIHRNVATQTQTLINIETSIDENESKDDKLIKLLYPEFKLFSKLDLIKLILEKNDAIRELMK